MTYGTLLGGGCDDGENPDSAPTIHAPGRLGIFIEWRHAPSRWDKSFGCFFTHVRQLQPVTLIKIAVGTFLAHGRERRTSD